MSPPNENKITTPNAVASQAFVCLEGEERPLFVGKFTGSGDCGPREAREAYKIALDSYENSCSRDDPEMKAVVDKVKKFQKRPRKQQKNLGVKFEHNLWGYTEWIPKSLSKREKELFAIFAHTAEDNRPINFKSNRPYKFKPAVCSAPAYNSFPKKLEDLGLSVQWDPFVERIIHSVNFYQLQDFRSMGAFNQVAFEIGPQLISLKKKEFNALVIAGGSHMSPLVTVLKLLDWPEKKGGLARAKITYTEVDENSVKRMEAYLKAYFGRSDFSKNKKDFQDAQGNSQGYEVRFSFKYRGKPVEVIMAIKRSGQKYSREEYWKDANLIVMHDTGMDYKQELDFIRPIFNHFSRQDRMAKAKNPTWLMIQAWSDQGIKRLKTQSKLPPGVSAEVPENIVYTFSQYRKFGKAIKLEGPYGHGDALRAKAYDSTWVQKGDRIIKRSADHENDPFLSDHNVSGLIIHVREEDNKGATQGFLIQF